MLKAVIETRYQHAIYRADMSFYFDQDGITDRVVESRHTFSSLVPRSASLRR